MTTTSTSVQRITVSSKPEMTNPQVNKLMKTLNEFFDISIEDLRINKGYAIQKPLTTQQLNAIANGPLVDPILETSSLEEVLDHTFDWTVEITFKPGLTDNLGKTAQLTIEDFLGIKFQNKERVQSFTQYLFKGNLSRGEVQLITENLLANLLVEDVEIRKHKESPIEEINLQVSDNALLAISKERQLALNLQEMQTIQEYYLRPEIREERSRFALPANPTDVELEALAQTWSEHCKHKIFNAKIRYTENKETEEIDSLFHTYIKGATDKIAEQIDWLVSVFSDNAGIIRFNETYNLAFKVETHNSPSALDPYGGALTGILGVNRDIMGAGAGARLLANTDIFCFAPPDYAKPLPKRLLHPKRVFEGVRYGVEHGGNKSGVPTVNGAIVFDERYLGKPLVYCGTAGIMPAEINGEPTHIKNIHPGDHIIIAGGRTGKDGIHGATFSSEELHAGSPTSAVQIGDPFTQKKLHDFLLEARDASLYRTLTDDGAGGFSSSVGELAQLSGGCEIHLDKVLLKSDDLVPWEILVSESQERMTLAVTPEAIPALLELAKVHEVEIVDIGTFTDSNRFHVLYEGTTVGLLTMEFLHDGRPQMELEAEWIPPIECPLKTPEPFLSIDSHQVLSGFNVCSKESIIRQYDHEVQGGTILKPLQGGSEDGPGDAAIVLPIECANGNEGVVISNGICPRYSDIDTYHMAANAIDEAIRNAVAVGCDPQQIAILDNFCWPDPIFDPEKNPNGRHKLAQLVRANKALYDYSLAFGTPIISGKDSMKNDYKIGETKISVPPTLLISAIGKIPDINKAVSMDIKCPGDWVYVIGITKHELGGSEYAHIKGMTGGVVPKVDAEAAKSTYTLLFKTMQNEWVASCHDCSDGGLAIALIESAFAGGYGMTLDLHSVPMEDIDTDTELLFSESASRFVVTVAPENAKAFEKCLQSTPFGRIGVVNEEAQFVVTGIHGETIIDEEIITLKQSWEKTL
ncbi:MAG: AIR synthase-related protein [Waddliaceae bacterium]